LGALAPLVAGGVASVVTDPRWWLHNENTAEAIAVAEVPYVQENVYGVIRGLLERLPGPLARGAPRVLCVHAGIKDENTPPWLRDAPDSIEVAQLWQLAHEFKLAGVFAGNWHEHKVWNGTPMGLCPVVQVGALAPTGWDNQGDGYGRIVLVRATPTGVSITMDSVEAPKFITVSYEEADKEMSALGATSSTFVRLRCPPGREHAAQALLDGYTRRRCAAGGIVQTVDVPAPGAPKLHLPAVSAEQSIMEYEADIQARELAVQYLRKAG
jgi:hypothetical protein